MARPGWLNENMMRNFPLRNASDELDKSLLVDAGFFVGAGSSYDETSDTISLDRIRRESDILYFDCVASASGLVGVSLTFEVPIATVRFTTFLADSEGDSGPILWSQFFHLLYTSGSANYLVYSGDEPDTCDRAQWSGFLVIGDLTDLLIALPGDGELDLDPDAIFETAIVQNGDRSFVKSFALANADRTRVTAPAGCDPIVWPFDTGLVYNAGRCFTGSVLLMPGYNAALRQDPLNNAIVFSAAAGAGEGFPCDEVPVFADESLPDDSPFLSGGPQCADVLRSLNGVSERLFSLLAGNGVVVSQDPGNNAIIVDVNMAAMATCAEGFSEL